MHDTVQTEVRPYGSENRGRFLRFTRFLLLTGKLISAGKCFELKKFEREKKKKKRATLPPSLKIEIL